MNNRFYIFLYCVFILLPSCQEEVDLSIPQYPSKPVVNCVFSPDTSFFISLTQSLPTDQNKMIPLYDGTIHLYENDQWIKTIHHNRNGVYISNTIAEENCDYTIQVEAPEFESLTARSKVPEQSPILKMNHFDSVRIDQNDFYLGRIDVTFKDPPGNTNYYELFICKRIDTSSIILNPEYLPLDFVDSIMMEHIQYDNSYSMLPLISNDPNVLGNTKHLNTKGSPFDDYSQILYFNDRLFDGKEYTIKINYLPYYYYQGSNQYYLIEKRYFKVYLRSISKDYYVYQQKWSAYRDYQGAELWKNPADFVRLHSNVENGYGLFVGYSQSVDSIQVIRDY